jgi:hypothetical protein
LVKCTGIHSAVMCNEGSSNYILWTKPDEEWGKIVESLDPERDVLLFPYPDSIIAEDFPWTGVLSGTVADKTPTESTGTKRWRLVVLEASWAYAKTMSQQIINYRKEKGLPPLPSVGLREVVGKYWRFHSEGHSAVSTIEAIAHTARAAGCSEEANEALLLLFRVQRHRVMRHTYIEGAKTPRAVDASGSGVGSWRDIEIIPNETNI